MKVQRQGTSISRIVYGADSADHTTASVDSEAGSIKGQGLIVHEGCDDSNSSKSRCIVNGSSSSSEDSSSSNISRSLHRKRNFKLMGGNDGHEPKAGSR